MVHFYGGLELQGNCDFSNSLFFKPLFCSLVKHDFSNPDFFNQFSFPLEDLFEK